MATQIINSLSAYGKPAGPALPGHHEPFALKPRMSATDWVRPADNGISGVGSTQKAA
jgi:hypothetical protein